MISIWIAIIAAFSWLGFFWFSTPGQYDRLIKPVTAIAAIVFIAGWVVYFVLIGRG